MRRGGLVFALVTFVGTSLSALVFAAPSGAATNQQNTDDGTGGNYSGCPGFSAQANQGSNSSGEPANAWGWSGNASPGSDSPPTASPGVVPSS